MVRQLLVMLVIGALCVSGRPSNAEEEAAAAESLSVFEQRIMPIFRSPKPSSCVQCHLASVDLKNYILPSAEKTFVSLRDQGLIDLSQPENSKILSLIQMGEKDLDRGAKLIHQRTRQSEYDAFVAWITACAADPRLRELPPLSEAEVARPEKMDAVIRHNRKDRLLDSFVRNIWSQRMRCFPCHTPFEIDETDGKHPQALANYRKLEAEFGQRMNIFQETPEATLRQLILSSNRSVPGRLPMINVQDPAKSLLVLKPTSKLPAKDDNGDFEKASSTEPVSHRGGLKMFVNDQSWKSFVSWIEDYARVVGDDYESADDLPADNWYPTQQVLRLSQTPEDWPAMTGVQFFIHAWDRQQNEWAPHPAAFTQGLVTPRRMVNGTLFVLGSEDGGKSLNSLHESLPAGKYLVKAYVDRQSRLNSNPTMWLSSEDYVGQAEIEAQWLEGFQQAEMLPAARLRKSH